MPSRKKAPAKSAAEKTCEFLARSSVPLREIGEDSFPVGIASGCLTDYGGKRWILTVAHATRNNGRWAVEMCFDEQRGAKLWCVGVMNFLDLVRPSDGTGKQLDLAYAVVPSDLHPLFEPRNENAELIRSVPRFVFRQPDLSYKPGVKKCYGFAGNVFPSKEHHFGLLWHGT